MSQAPPEPNNVPNTGTGNHHYPPQSSQNQAPVHGVSHLIDGSGPIFSMYLERAKEADEKMAENWKADADGILIFTGLFSAAVATLISVSIQDIQQSPQDTSNFYLANIYQAITDQDRLNISAPSSPPPFTPPNYAVWVNGLWFLSLLISITCALLATLLQQWARRYLKVTQPPLSLHKRARIRSFFAEGVEKSFLPLVVEALPTLLHLSLFLFFAGLVVFLWNINLTIFKMALSWVGLCAALYGCITFVPIIRRDSPYYTPLTPLARLIYVAILRVFLYLHFCFVALPCICYWYYCPCCDPDPISDPISDPILSRDRDPGPHRDHRLCRALRSTFKTTEEIALETPSEIDARAFMWTFDSLDEDHEFERFFSSLPNFRSSKVVDDPLPILTANERSKIFQTLTRFLDYTLSSDLLPEAVKSQRANMCARALDPAEIFEDSGFRFLQAVFDSGPQTTNFRPIANDSRTEQTLFIQAIATGIAARPRRRDDSWFRQVAPNALGIPETVLRNYAANGGSLSLAILIHVTRQQFAYFPYLSWPTYEFRGILEAVSEFNAQDTLPELQHEFCTLWNKIVLKARNDNNRKIAWDILSPLRKVYAALHHDTVSAPIRFSAHTGNRDVILEDPFSYPECTVVGHVHDSSAPTSFVRPAPHHYTALVPPSLPCPDVPSLDNFHPAPTTAEGPRVLVTSTSEMRDIDASVITMPQPNPEIPMPASSPPAESPHNAEPLTCSEFPNLLSSASLNPALDNMVLTELHRSIIVSTAPSASPGMTFAPDMRVAAEDDCHPKAGPRNEEDTFDCPGPLVNRAIRANIMAAPNLQVQSSSMLSTTDSDVVIAGPSPRELNPECTGDHPWHSRYDAV